MKKILNYILVCAVAMCTSLGIADAASFYNKDAENTRNAPKATKVDPKTGQTISFLPSVAVIPVLTDMQALPDGVYDQINLVIGNRLDYQSAMPYPQEKVIEALKTMDFEENVTANGLTEELLQRVRQKLGVDVIMAVYIKDIEEETIVSSNAELLVLKYKMDLMAVDSWRAPIISKLNNKVDSEYVFIARTNFPAQQLGLAVDRFMDKVLNFKK